MRLIKVNTASMQADYKSREGGGGGCGFFINQTLESLHFITLYMHVN